MIERAEHRSRLAALLRQFPVVALLGARQVGKTTLARDLAAEKKTAVTFFDLEDAEDLALLQDPLLALRPLRGLIVIDEVQRCPNIFATLRVLADEPQAGRRFLVLGSASPELLRQTSESLAGRIAYHELDGFSLAEVGPSRWERLWRRGGFPRSFLARTETESQRWRQELIRTYLERDIPALELHLPAPTLRRFWMMLAHYHGQIWNASELARSFGVAHTTVQRYMDILSETFMVRQLPSWHANVGKRQVKAPKVFIRDSGLLHALLGLRTAREIDVHPKCGASWEGFAMQAVLTRLGARAEECFFWATHSGAELDLLVMRGQQRLGFEFKRSSAPVLTKSMHVALQDLRLRKLWVVHAGERSADVSRHIRVSSLARILEELQPLR
ncbi:MAG: ATP-binding protein [Vicinamibacteria bacterium]|jgi:hypothetical protein|nr:ATP-binding protein [Vicinamibacteria bacterium]